MRQVAGLHNLALLHRDDIVVGAELGVEFEDDVSGLRLAIGDLELDRCDSQHLAREDLGQRLQAGVRRHDAARRRERHFTVPDLHHLGRRTDVELLSGTGASAETESRQDDSQRQFHGINLSDHSRSLSCSIPTRPRPRARSRNSHPEDEDRPEALSRSGLRTRTIERSAL